MFNIKQRMDESLKVFLERFCDFSMRLVDPNKGMLVRAFVKGLHPNLFSESLLRIPEGR